GTAFESSQHLLGVIEREGIDACFLASESMAVATDQRDLWETERGMALESDYAEQAAEYGNETWVIYPMNQSWKPKLTTRTLISASHSTGRRSQIRSFICSNPCIQR